MLPTFNQYLQHSSTEKRCTCGVCQDSIHVHVWICIHVRTSSTPELTKLKNSNTVYQTYYFKKRFRENYDGVGQKGG